MLGTPVPNYTEAYDGLRELGFDVFLGYSMDEWDRIVWRMRWKMKGAHWTCEGWDLREVAHKSRSWLAARNSSTIDERRFATRVET